MYAVTLSNVCLIFALIFLPSIVECKRPRVIGGHVVQKSYPFMVSIRTLNQHFCGGSIINARTVVTAAHCLYMKRARVLTVHVGDNALKVIEGQVHGVEVIHYHEMWDDETLDYDVGLIRIKDCFNFGNTVQPIQLAEVSDTIPDNSLATVLGWGYTNLSSQELSECLREAQVPIVNEEECRMLLPGRITERMLCAGYILGGVDACIFDSGGPLIANDILIGIVSWGILCALPFWPGVYARVSVLRPWIENTLLDKYNETLENRLIE